MKLLGVLKQTYCPKISIKEIKEKVLMDAVSRINVEGNYSKMPTAHIFKKVFLFFVALWEYEMAMLYKQYNLCISFHDLDIETSQTT